MANSRVSRLREAMKLKSLDAIWITGDVNRQYLTGFTGSSGYVLITLDKSYLLTDFRYMTQAADQAAGFEIVEHGSSVAKTLKELLAKQKISELGFEEENVVFSTYRAYEQELQPVKLIPSAGLVEGLRLYKDDHELALMKQAAELADQTYMHMLKVLRPGVTEREMALEIEIFMRRNGATSSCFDTIVASGERSALPHGVASDRVLRSDEFVKMDFGALLNSYCSDITRTVVLGKPAPKHREIYDIVLEAQLHTLAHLRPGMTGREADALARDIIVRYGYGEQFGHSTGHGLGMEVHEAPRLSKLSDDILQPGMVVTVEPGIYIPGFGGVRIEDDVVITEGGCRRLTESSKEFTVIDC
ncbi:Xaa-Pro peptidase family protein [Paenibacillus woosongensis]|uniref:Xaa-Pro peptidase family protein n=1 Tax=Paenibacillus woosongensis TaxID=307580 RepID=A0AA95HZ21_9BACL|nr:Xaa-Pro peptidase family protein [Paenibacillus woosongensis]WHX47474.1 Xaa-Pro peptidase family protein [Paenibacillus woosongensis]